MTAEVDIANYALSYIGQPPIQSFTERSNAAAQAKLHFAAAVREVAVDFDWPFLRGYRQLVQLDLAVPANWTYAYSVPANCLKPLRLVRDLGLYEPTPFQLFSRTDEPNQSELILVTGVSPATLIFTRGDVPPERFDPTFCDAVAWKLAAKLAMPLTKNAQIVSGLGDAYLRAINAARTVSANSEPTNVNEPLPEWIRVRNYNGG